MKNLKRVLSLALTGVMLVGMMAIGASAANKDFTDADEIVNVEAVDVMSTLGVLKGKDTGAFDPKATVTRAEMAKIITVMLNGGNDPTLGSGSNAMFTDINSHWAKNYIEYCASMGIIAGMGDGTFGPDLPVTGGAAAKMLLVALGYDSDIFGFTGADWEINVNRIANTEAKLYEEIKSIDTSAGLSRDDTAQMAYNALEAKLMVQGYDKVVSSGEISYNYGLGNETFLNKYFGANTFIGTFENNDKTGTGLNKGFIEVVGKLDTAEEDDKDKTAKFPYDFDIANLGEEVKVIFKDGKSGTKGQPDKNDTIFGVFNTGATETVLATLNDISAGDDSHKDPDKVEIDDVVYTMADQPTDTSTPIAVVKDYGAQTAVKVAKDGTTYKQAIEGVAAKTGDTIKLLLKDGKVYRAYVTTYTLAKVTAVSSTKVTLSGVGSIEIADNDVYEGVAKDDIVVYTKFYKEAKDDAFYTVTKAETVEGKITGYDATKKVSIDGTSYNIPRNTLKDLTDDKLMAFKDEIGTEVKAYLVAGMVGAVDKIDDTVSNYALVVGATTSSTSDKTLSDGRIRLMTTDGTKTTYNVDEKSTYQPAAATDDSKKEVAAGTLVKYSVTSSGTVKISNIYLTKKNTTDAWDADTKVVAAEAVAESGAVLYYTNPDGDYKVSAIRDLKTIDNKVFKAAKDVFFIKNDAGKIVAAYVDAKQNLPGATTSRLYGMVIAAGGTVKVGDDECTTYTVWTGTDEVKVNLIVEDGQATLEKGQFVTFEESVDTTYSAGDVVLVSAYDTDNVDVIDAAVKEYSAADKIVSYYTKLVTKKDGEATLYVPEADEQDSTKDKAPETLALDKDAVIIYVDADGKKPGADAGVSSYDNLKGYANVKMLKKDGVVVVMFVETSTEKNINGTKDTLAAGAPAPEKHEHVWSEFTDDNGTHKRTCTGDKGTCEATQADKEHTGEADTKYTTDETQHWKVCKTEGCNIVMEAKADHYKDAEGDWSSATTGDTCKVCGYEKK